MLSLPSIAMPAVKLVDENKVDTVLETLSTFLIVNLSYTIRLLFLSVNITEGVLKTAEARGPSTGVGFDIVCLIPANKET